MQNLDRLLVSSPDRNPPLHTWLHHPPRTQKSRRSIHPPHTRLPNEDPPRCSTLVYRRYNTVYRGTWPSKRILSASIGISGPPASSRKSRRRGARGTNVEGDPHASWLFGAYGNACTSNTIRETKIEKVVGSSPLLFKDRALLPLEPLGIIFLIASRRLWV